MGPELFVLTIHFFAVGDLTIFSDGTARIVSSIHTCGGLKLDSEEHDLVTKAVEHAKPKTWLASYPPGVSPSEHPEIDAGEWAGLTLRAGEPVFVEWSDAELLPKDLRRIRNLSWKIGRRLKDVCVRRKMGDLRGVLLYLQDWSGAESP